MHQAQLRARRPQAAPVRHHEARKAVGVSALALVVIVGLLVVGARRDATTTQAALAVLPQAPAAAAATAEGDLVGSPELAPAEQAAALAAATEGTPALAPDCRIEADRLAWGDEGLDVSCLQQALIREGYLAGTVSGDFDTSTTGAVEDLQTTENLFVDGVVGRETALFLNIWRDEYANVVRTPAPAPGTYDSMGYELSPVASTGADAPPLPENSGSGRRVVYSREEQRVWAVSSEGEIIRSWLVSGSKYSNEQPGTHRVYSRSEQSTAWNGAAILPLMIRWLKTDIGAIGFHGIPTHVEDGSPYQTDAELGTRLSGGCQRQNNMDARFLWAFADVGTVVVVV
ncbi:MAG: peptidoglycan-binding protein [Desertimonas sp.]